MPNSIINSDDGVVSGQSGLKTTGGDTGGTEFQSNGTVVFDYAPTQVVARQTFYAIDDGVPIVARSTNSNSYKYGMEDTSGGTARGYLGANSSNAFMVANGSATNVLNVTSAGVLQVNSGYGSVANAYMCRAWVQFVNTTIYGSANVSSITNLGTGQFNIVFATAMPDANYVMTGITTINSGIASCAPESGVGGGYVLAGSLRIATRQSSTGNYLAGGTQYVAIFR